MNTHQYEDMEVRSGTTVCSPLWRSPATNPGSSELGEAFGISCFCVRSHKIKGSYIWV